MNVNRTMPEVFCLSCILFVRSLRCESSPVVILPPIFELWHCLMTAQMNKSCLPCMRAGGGEAGRERNQMLLKTAQMNKLCLPCMRADGGEAGREQQSNACHDNTDEKNKLCLPCMRAGGQAGQERKSNADQDKA